MKQHDRFLTRRCLRNGLRRAQEDKRLRSALFAWVREDDGDLEAMDAAFLLPKFREAGLDETEDGDVGFGRRPRPPRRRRGSRPSGASGGRAEEKVFLTWAVAALDRSLAEPPREGADARATALAARRFSLEGACGPILELARLYAGRRSAIGQLWDSAQERFGDHLETTAVLLGVSARDVGSALRRLSEVGIADPESWGTTRAEPDDYVDEWFERVYRPPVASEEELRQRLAPLAKPPLLALDDFAHLDGRDDAVRLLGGALESGEGARLLFHGRPGTGKTEFAKTLARSAGGRLYDLGGREPADAWRKERADRNHDPRAAKRNRLRMAQTLLASEPRAVVLCDEVEDVLSSEAGRRGHNHRLLEEAPVPLLFTGNDLSQFDEAMLRRFDLTIRFKVHSPTRRRSVVRRMLESSGLADGEPAALPWLSTRLADELECPHATIERAIHVTRLVKGSAEDLFRFAERHERTVSTHIARPRLGPPVTAALPWAAFEHLGRQADDIRQLLAAALCARRRRAAEGQGISFLAYGPPGGGKTEFCRTLAAEVGATLYSVGSRELGPEARRPVPRRASLEYALEALADEPEAIILFDEIEDFVFKESKHRLNGLVETSPVPLLFTANSTEDLQCHLPHFLDRLTHSLEFRQLPARRRAGMFGNLLGASRSPEMTPLAEKLAADRRVTPRQVRNAARVAMLSGGGAQAAGRAAREKDLLRRDRRRAESKAAAKYDFSLVHADRDLAALADRIGDLGPRRLGILLDGPSGSGKSEYAKQLAKRMGLDPLPKRASELMSKWVGETERQIAGAFAEARASESFLILDEADSLLADRRGAARHWEISMVNEILSQLETHDLPYAFTTNLADLLDPAAARRFLFRATFRYLDPPRTARAWEFFFGGEIPPRTAALTRLVPADFALVRERAEALGFLDDPAKLAAELATQSGDRSRTTPIGF